MTHMEQRDTIRPTDLAAQLNVSVAYASQLLTGARVPSIMLALSIFDKSGLKLGPLTQASDEQIELLRKLAA
jgi:transcriptional regulator with XRE-family HTH domain